MKQAASYRGRDVSNLEGWGKRIGATRTPPQLRAWMRRVFHWLLEVRSGGRGMRCRLPEGEEVRVTPEFRFLSWNLDEYRAFRAAVKPGNVALDIGANIGAYTLLLGQWVQPGGRVFAFEPMPLVQRALQRHVQLNQLTGSVTPIQAAVSDQAGRTSLVSGDSLGSSRLASAGMKSGSIIEQVDVTTVDAFCAERGIIPDFIKIDVEGFETSVLRGARETIQQAKGRLAMFVELHPTTWREIGVTREEFLGELAVQNLRCEGLDPSQDPWSVEGLCVRLVPA